MKKKLIIIMLILLAWLTSCIEGFTAFTEQPKTVRAFAPEMDDLEMVSMTQMPGWQILAGTQWIGKHPTNTIKGVNDDLNACFLMEGSRNYTQNQHVKSGTFDGKTLYLNLMSAAEYLDYVFYRQFPDVKNVKRTVLKTLDMYSDAERQQLEAQRSEMFTAMVNYMKTAPGGADYHISKATADRATVEFRWLQENDSIVQIMEVSIIAIYNQFRSAYYSESSINWQQLLLTTVTAPVKNIDKTKSDLEQMIPTIEWNKEYNNMLTAIIMEDVRQNEDATRRIMYENEQAHLRHQQEMAQSAIRHQQKMAQIMQETNDYIYKSRQDVYANRQASQERINQGWRDAVVGVDRYMGADGKVVEVPVSAGSKVWQSADGGTIYTSDSYLFNAVDNLYDKNGKIQEFKQLQLLK